MGQRKQAVKRNTVARRIQRLRREGTYTLIGHKGQVLRGRVITRERTLVLLRII